MSERLVPVGRVGKPHGLDGAFVVEDASDDPARFAVGAILHVDGVPTKVVVNRRVGRGRPAILLDRAVARGAGLAVRESDLATPDADAWYAFELVGLQVVDDNGAPLGRVVDAHPGVANDNLELDDGTLVPLIGDAVREVDVAGERIVVIRGFLA